MAPKAKGCSFFEPLTNVSYLYDGTQEGLLSAVFESYERHEIPDGIFAEFEYQPRLDESSYFVETSMERSCRVGACVERIAGKKALIAVLRAAASESPERGMVVYDFVRYAIESNRTGCSRSKMLDDLTSPALSNLSRISRCVANEEEKMRQFVRFRHLESGIWFAECNPNAKRFDELTFDDILNLGLKVIYAQAAEICKEAKIEGFVFNMAEENNIVKAVKGEARGTVIKY